MNNGITHKRFLVQKIVIPYAGNEIRYTDYEKVEIIRVSELMRDAKTSSKKGIAVLKESRKVDKDNEDGRTLIMKIKTKSILLRFSLFYRFSMSL